MNTNEISPFFFQEKRDSLRKTDRIQNISKGESFLITILSFFLYKKYDQSSIGVPHEWQRL